MSEQLVSNTTSKKADNLRKFADSLSEDDNYKFYSKTQVVQLFEYLCEHGVDTNEFLKSPPKPHPKNEGTFGWVVNKNKY